MCHCCILFSQFFFWRPRRLLPSVVSRHPALHDVFCNGIVSSNVVKLGEIASFQCGHQGQGLLLSSKEVHFLPHIFVCLVFSIYTDESRGTFGFKCLYASLCLCCQSPALASVEEDGHSECSVELELCFEADVSALPYGVKS